MNATVTVKPTNKGKAELIVVETPFGTFQRETLKLGAYDYMAVGAYLDYDGWDANGQRKLNGKTRYYATFSATGQGARKNAETYHATCVYLVKVRTGQVLHYLPAPVATPEPTPQERRKAAADRKQGRFTAQVVMYLSLSNFENDERAAVVEVSDKICGFLDCATRHSNGHRLSAYSAKQQAEDKAREWEYSRNGQWTKLATISPIKAHDYSKDDPYLRCGYQVKDIKTKRVLVVYAVREAQA